MNRKSIATTALFACVLLFAAREAQAFYNPSSGRWLSRDPIEEKGGVNLTCFIRNQTISRYDVLGRWISDETLNAKAERCRGAVVVLIPAVPNPIDHKDNGAEDSVRKGALSHAGEEGYNVLSVEDNLDANKQMKALTGCCIKELNITGHGAGNGQWVGSSRSADSKGKWVGIKPNSSGGYDKFGFELFDGIKFCKPCTIWLRGCSTTTGPGGEVMLRAIATATGCTVKGFCVNAYVGSDGLGCPNLGWWNDRAVTDTAQP